LIDRPLRETEKKIIGMWSDGLSASQIGVNLNVTKNTISGILARLRAKGVDLGRPPVMKKVEVRPLPPSPPATSEPSPAQGEMTLMQLTATTCRWPYGDARKGGVTYCGMKTKGDVYCTEHCLRAYAPTR
jgi:GcrA cell cycle regulator